MRYPRKLYFGLIAVAGLIGSARGQDGDAVTNGPAAAAGTNFESYRLIVERNIFNQSRSPRAVRREAPPARVAPKVQSLALVGTMSYAKGEFAFFDGTKPEYKKPVKTGEKIGGYEIKEITPASVKVANETQEFDLKVGQELRREDDGDWSLATSPRERPSGPLGETESGSTGSGSEDEALKRLMEKRAKELNP
jgi:hypothetical protein